MKHIIANLNQHILDRCDLHATPIYQDLFPGVGADEIMCRMEPGSAIDQRYLDGGRTGTFSFAYYSKSTDMNAARDSLDQIISVLDLPTFTDIGYETRIKIEPVSTTAFVQKTDQNELVYTASFKLEYYKE